MFRCRLGPGERDVCELRVFSGLLVIGRYKRQPLIVSLSTGNLPVARSRWPEEGPAFVQGLGAKEG